MMTKHGAVRAGETPSEVSGKPSEVIKQGRAVKVDEEAPTGEESLQRALANSDLVSEDPS